MTPPAFKYDICGDLDLLLDRAALDIQLLKGKCVFVTGATGFFGLWLLCALVHIKKLLGSDLRLLALSRNPQKFLNQHPEFELDRHVEFITADVSHFNYARGDITHLVHMAATNAAETFAGQDQLSKLDMLYTGTQNVLEQCAGRLESVLLTSSGVAYGRCHAGKVCESEQGLLDTTDERSALALGKLVAEYLVCAHAEKQRFQYSIARCFSFAGPYLPLNLHYAFGNFILNAMRREPIVIQGDGMDRRSYLYIGDAIAWLLRLLLEPRNRVYNVGAEHELSISELASRVAKLSGDGLEVTVLGATRPEGNFHRPGYLPSTARIRSDYPGLAEWTDVDQVIEKMLAMNPLGSARKQLASVPG